MHPPEVHFSRPVYESLPWVYLFAGLALLVASYALQGTPFFSFLAGLVGIVGVIAGIVILLRRRDYREMKARYKG